MPTRTVDLTEDQDLFIAEGITSGRFADAGEPIREGLRLLEQRQQGDAAKLEWLRAAAKEGFDQLDRGEGIQFESDEDFAAFVEKLANEVAEEVEANRRCG